LKDYGYAGIDESSKVRHLLKCIKTNELDVCKMQVMVSPNLCDDFTATVQLYANFIKQMQAEKSQLNVSEVSFAHWTKGEGNNSYGKRCSSGISYVSNATVYDRFFEKHEYHALTSEQNNTLCIKRPNRGHAGNGQGCGGNNNGKGGGKVPQAVNLKSMSRSIATPGGKFYKFNIPHDDGDQEEDPSEKEEGTSNSSNSSLTQQSKKKKRRGKWKLNLSAFTMRMGYVGRVGGISRSDLDYHTDVSVVGK
jgi:hypothetical protein